MKFLEIQNMSKSFDGLDALKDITLSVDEGVIFGLIGPNGAGKTTLLNCISRVYTPECGSMVFRGEDLLARPIHRIAELGIGRTFQNLELLQQTTARENVLIGCLRRFRTNLLAELFSLPASRRAIDQATREADETIRKLGIDQYSNMKASELPYGVQKAIELARTLVEQPRLLLLDEPAAGLNPEETLQLAKVIQQLRDKHGISVLLIEHDMHFVMSICDRILVLDHGEALFEGTPREVRCNPKVIEAYLGEEICNA
jgi:branched-chain amino acid transport system ATP-binding protein